jgi:hypothetical protein
MVSDSKREVSSVKKSIKLIFTALTTIILLTTATACSSSGDSAESGITLKAGETITFEGNIAGGIENGWSSGDGLRTWSDGYLSVLKFNYTEGYPSGINMLVSMGSFVNNKNPKMNVIIKANDVVVKELNFNEALSGGDISIDIPSEILKKNVDQLILSFVLPDATVPNEIGWNEDVRRLGVWITQIQIKSL